MAIRNKVLAENRMPGNQFSGILFRSVLAKTIPMAIPITKGLIASAFTLGIFAINVAMAAMIATRIMP